LQRRLSQAIDDKDDQLALLQVRLAEAGKSSKLPQPMSAAHDTVALTRIDATDTPSTSRSQNDDDAIIAQLWAQVRLNSPEYDALADISTRRR
jgi:hypothetical protein